MRANMCEVDGQVDSSSVDGIITDVLVRLPSLSDQKVARDRMMDKHGGLLPLNMFLLQEHERLHFVVSKACRLFEDVKMIVSGQLRVCGELLEVVDELSNARTPHALLGLGVEKRGMGEWVDAVVARADQLERWLLQRPKSLWLGGFFNPHGLVTSCCQEAVRKHQGWSLEDVVVKAELTKHETENVKEVAQDGVFVNGLALVGGTWNVKEAKLIEAAPKSLHSPLPLILISGIQKGCVGSMRATVNALTRPQGKRHNRRVYFHLSSLQE